MALDKIESVKTINRATNNTKMAMDVKVLSDVHLRLETDHDVIFSV